MASSSFSSTAGTSTAGKHRFSPPSITRLPLPPDLREPTSIGPFRELFRRRVRLVAVRVKAREVGEIRQLEAIKGTLLNYARIQAIIKDPSSEQYRLFLLDTPDRSSLPTQAKQAFSERGEFVDHELDLDYAYFSTDEVLGAVLPEKLLDEVPSAFTMIGHIAHLNLREDYLPYRHLIAEVISDKNLRVETVVNKIDSIHNEFRFFDMEVLAGKPDMNVSVVENNCTFKFDFSKVYYNSRLSTEHGLAVSLIPPSSVVIDAFAGVGPFAVPLAKKGCGVIASDLNPASVEALADAVTSNGVEGRCRVGVGDGREMMRTGVVKLWRSPFPAVFLQALKKNAWRGGKPPERAAKKSASKNAQPPAPSPIEASITAVDASSVLSSRRLATHFIMNLPDTAINFLDAFRGIYSPLRNEPGFLTTLAGEDGDGEARMPFIICYCFTREDEGEPAMRDINARVSAVLGYTLTPDTVHGYDLYFVRSVAPKKDYYRLIFRLPSKVAFDVDLAVLGHNHEPPHEAASNA